MRGAISIPTRFGCPILFADIPRARVRGMVQERSNVRDSFRLIWAQWAMSESLLIAERLAHPMAMPEDEQQTERHDLAHFAPRLCRHVLR